MQIAEHPFLLPEIDFLLRPEDVQGIRSLVGRSGVFNEAEIAIAGELAEDALSGADSSYRFCFYRDERGAPIAYTCYGEIPLTDKRFDLYWIAVDPSYRKQGLAARLLAQTEAAIRQLGGVHLYAETSGTAPYAPARNFYLNQKFIEIARLPDFYRKDDTKVVFCKYLLDK